MIPDGESRLSDAARRAPIGRLVTVDEVAWLLSFFALMRLPALSGRPYLSTEERGL